MERHLADFMYTEGVGDFFYDHVDGVIWDRAIQQRTNELLWERAIKTLPDTATVEEIKARYLELVDTTESIFALMKLRSEL